MRFLNNPCPTRTHIKYFLSTSQTPKCQCQSKLVWCTSDIKTNRCSSINTIQHILGTCTAPCIITATSRTSFLPLGYKNNDMLVENSEIHFNESGILKITFIMMSEHLALLRIPVVWNKVLCLMVLEMSAWQDLKLSPLIRHHNATS